MSCNCRHRMQGILDAQAMKKAQEEAKQRKAAIKAKAPKAQHKTEDIIETEALEDKPEDIEIR